MYNGIRLQTAQGSGTSVHTNLTGAYYKEGDPECRPKDQTADDEVRDLPMENPNLFQGDLLLTPAQTETMVASLQQQLLDLINGVTDVVGEVKQNIDGVIDNLSQNRGEVGVGLKSILDKGNGETASKRKKRSVQGPLSYEWVFPIKYYVSPSVLSTTKQIKKH
uniref:t-SNARE coiled-coil homology domain-containing protein n=1 Tax=Rhabditophanes sp. KR3021 TaxID=114890 RepID=A0AC35TXX5_9BILA